MFNYLQIMRNLYCRCNVHRVVKEIILLVKIGIKRITFESNRECANNLFTRTILIGAI